MVNDLPPGTSLGAITVGDVYSVSGNLLTLTGDVTSSGDSRLAFSNDLKLGGPVRFSYAFVGPIDINGQTLTAEKGGIVGPISGIGTIISSAMYSGFGLGSGNFTGTIRGGSAGGGLILTGSCSLPNATVVMELIQQASSGAQLGDLTIAPSLSGYVSPGPNGVLHTKSLTFSAPIPGGFGGGLVVFVNPSGNSQMDVTGAVTLNGAQLGISASGAPAIGQRFTIINNDGTEPVIGTFAGFPEGASIGSTFTISYHGGDGNDVVLTRDVPAIKTWTGAVSANWSNAANWSPAALPVAGEPLIFQAGAAHRDMINDLPSGTSCGVMTVEDVYTVSGNLLTLTGNVNASGSASGFGLKADLKLAASLSFNGVSVTGPIDINGQTLTVQNAGFNGPINGNGTIVISSGLASSVLLNGSGNFSGAIHGGSSGGSLDLGSLCSLPNATVAIELIRQIGNSATLGELAITPSQNGYVSPGPGVLGPGTGSGGVLHTKSLALSPAASNGLGGGIVVFINQSGSSQMDVTGTVTLAGAALSPSISGTLLAGQTFTIINNDGTDPVVGTFNGLPEGATIGSSRLRISYAGGDGNDVVLTTLVATSTVISQSADRTQVGDPLTLTATVAVQSGMPTGSVVFTLDGVTIGTAPLQNGVAVLNVTTLVTGTHAILATFLGTGAFADSVSNSISHVIARGATQSVIVADHPGTSYGQNIRFTVTVSAQPPAAGLPTGSVTILADGAPLGTVPVNGGVAIFETAALHAGVKSTTATYSGDTNFDASTASAIQQTIAKAQTGVDARSASEVLIGQSPIISVFVNVNSSAAIAPTGTVSIREGGALLGAQTLARGVATLSLDPMVVGDHSLVVSYGGDTDFQESSAIIVQTVGAPSLSIHGARVIEGNRGVTNVSLVISLSAPVAAKVRVSFSTLSGTATAGEDYESASGVIEFGPGELTHAIELHVFGDTNPEADETFSVMLSAPVNATLDTPSALIVIANDDQVPSRRRPSGH
ncbi:MAG: fibronectin-binding autotransporter adhesin [Thermoanaerobaculia bacterium]|jgi:hypothetical protein|nr:fibronectin-binding autotransporter adhesin [Thermoanaerobaculia bacterium]